MRARPRLRDAIVMLGLAGLLAACTSSSGGSDGDLLRDRDTVRDALREIEERVGRGPAQAREVSARNRHAWKRLAART